MFTAVNENGNFIHLYEIKDKHYLRKLRSDFSFFCPECMERVILKVGEKKITHFAHERMSICSANREAESEYHLQGKLQLYSWLENLGLKPVLEPYFSAIKQRGDIGFNYQDKYYVIEYQCALISPELIAKRTNGYRKHHLHAIWIIGEKNVKSINRNKWRISAFIYQFITTFKNQYILPSYCPISKTFHFYHSLFPITINQVFATSHTLSIHSMLSPFSWTLPAPTNPFQQWKKEIRKQKIHHIHYQTKSNELFLKELYQNRLHPHFLPPYIGVPLQSMIHIETNPLFWQAYIILDHFMGENNKKIFSIHKITEQFQKRIIRGEIRIRELPMCAAISWKQAVYDYIHFLSTANILIEVKPLFYTLKKEVKLAVNYEKQFQLEDQFYREHAFIINKLFSFIE
ncbi:competence protein CoiA [Niallia sp. 03133]|uniref:competence protein CoiA n=1 Tax=Niallia sp. 03133 TaxID=3458060 RepID=UPI004044F7F3